MSNPTTIIPLLFIETSSDDQFSGQEVRMMAFDVAYDGTKDIPRCFVTKFLESTTFDDTVIP